MPVLTGEGGVEIAVHDLGGEGPELLLAHATSLHARTWLPVARHLAATFRCLAFDERGHGDSPTPPDGCFDWRVMAGDVLAVVDQLGLEQPFAVGHSCGGALLLLAEQARPGTFSALYCFEPIVAPRDDPAPPDPETPMAVRARRRREVFPSRRAAREHLAARPPFSSMDPEALDAYVEFGFDDLGDGSVRLTCRREDEASIYAHGFAHDAYRRLGAVRCPVTVAWGERTDVLGSAVFERLAARLPGGGTEVLPGLGHFGPLDAPAVVAASVLRAFGSASPSRPGSTLGGR